MATTTPNYGWPVPTSTDYVKDGATAIEALGDAIDATVFGLGSGLTFIGRTTVSNQATAIFDNVFSTTYKSYLVVIENIFSHNSVVEDLLLQFRFGATTQSTKSGSYYSTDIYALSNSSSVASQGVTNSTFCRLSDGIGDSTNPGAGYFIFEKVGNASEQPIFQSRTNYRNSTTYFGNDIGAGTNGSAEIYKGFLLYFATGNITVTATVYGLANS
jgi:hypothetical protein